MAERTLATSPEADIIRRIETLIRKLAAGTATENDRQELHDLQRRRVDLMRPKHFEKRKVSA